MQLVDDFDKACWGEGLLEMMFKEDRKILKEFAGRVHERFSDARVWAFGSRARGEATWESDLDIFVVLSDVDQKIDRWIRDIAWEVGFKNDRVITTVLLDIVQFEHGPMFESTIRRIYPKSSTAARKSFDLFPAFPLSYLSISFG